MPDVIISPICWECKKQPPESILEGLCFNCRRRCMTCREYCHPDIGYCNDCLQYEKKKKGSLVLRGFVWIGTRVYELIALFKKIRRGK